MTYLNRICLLMCLHITFILGLSTVNAITIFNTFKILQNSDILGEPFRTDELVVSRLDCSVRCSLTSGCSAVNFDTGQCKMFSWLDMSLTWDTTGNADIVNVDAIVIHATPGTGDLTFTEAKDFCKDIGGHLASAQDMYTARDAGYDLCRCGWVSDGSIRFVVQTNEPGCYSYDVGVNSCKWTAAAEDVYCRFNS